MRRTLIKKNLLERLQLPDDRLKKFRRIIPSVSKYVASMTKIVL